jgi:deoxyribonuclease-1
MFYMEETYGFRLSNQDQQLYTAWSRQDPPNAWEIERTRRIKAIQGRGNRFVEDYAAIFGKAATTPATPAVVPTATAPAAPVPAAPTPVAPPATAPTANPSGWTCGTKKTCGEMASCEEATFYLQQCGVKRLDGDGDGIPCASLCRR